MNEVIIKDSGKGSFVFESMNGVSVPIYTRGGIEKIEREESGWLIFTVRLFGFYNGKSITTSGPDARIMLRAEDGTLSDVTESLVLG